MFSDQLPSVPVTPVFEFVSWSVQTPGTHWLAVFLKSTVCPSRLEAPVERLPVGLNVPVNGAVPEAIGVRAESSKIVFTKFEPVPPTPENKVIFVPSGAIKVAARAESVGKAALSWTVSLATLNVPPKLGTVSVELSVPGTVAEVAAGIVWPRLSDAKNCGPETEPVGPMIWSTWPGVNVLTCMGRSNVTLNELLVPLTIRLSVPLEFGAETVVCGPGTINGSVFWLKGGLRMLAAPRNVTDVVGWGAGAA